MRKFQCLLFVLQRLYICYYIICMAVPLSINSGVLGQKICSKLRVKPTKIISKFYYWNQQSRQSKKRVSVDIFRKSQLLQVLNTISSRLKQSDDQLHTKSKLNMNNSIKISKWWSYCHMVVWSVSFWLRDVEVLDANIIFSLKTFEILKSTKNTY